MNHQWKSVAPKKEHSKIWCGQKLSVVELMTNDDASSINSVSVWFAVS